MLDSILRMFRRHSSPLIDPQSLIIQPDHINGAAAIHPQRFVALEGAINFRDLGGYATLDGRSVRWARVYRAGSFSRLTASDLAAIDRMGIRLICDLRSAGEVRQAPERLPGIRYEHIPIEAEDSVIVRVRALFFDRTQLSDLLVKAYSELMVGRNAHVFGTVFRRLADPENLPALIRCTAGKDRTGLAIALLLSMLGVPEDTIIADYSLSNLYFHDFQAFARRAIQPLGVFGVTVSDIQPLLLADPDTLRRCLENIRIRYGSIEAYVRDQAGVDADTQNRMRANLLE